MAMNIESLSAWLLLSFTPKLGGVGLSRLLAIDAPQKLVTYSSMELTKLGLTPTQVKYIQQGANREVEFCLNWQSQSEHHSILTPLSEDYPALLKNMSSQPPVLFVKGKAPVLSLPQIAVVGSRNASRDGLRAARDFSYDLASQGLAVTSGLALGVDGHAHDGALQAKGSTIAVLGSGVDNVYPARHKALAERILSLDGALVSEFVPLASPRAEHFPRRNRIISGLSQAVLIVEAAEKSGSLITARYALEQNRDVFAIPGSIFQPGFAGSNRLLQEGACIALSAQDIVSQSSLHSRSLQKNQQPEFQFTPAPPPISPPKKPSSLHPKLYSLLGYEPVAVDILAEQANIPVHEVMTQLLELELAGLASSVMGGYMLKS